MGITKKLPRCNCPQGPTKRLSEEYDAYFCKLCRLWCGEKCSDETCNYCRDRPDKCPNYIEGEE